MFIISVSQDFAVGVAYSTHELAEAAAVRMGLSKYEIVPVFTSSARVVTPASLTGPAALNAVKEALDNKSYSVAHDDGLVTLDEPLLYKLVR